MKKLILIICLFSINSFAQEGTSHGQDSQKRAETQQINLLPNYYLLVSDINKVDDKNYDIATAKLYTGTSKEKSHYVCTLESVNLTKGDFVRDIPCGGELQVDLLFAGFRYYKEFRIDGPELRVKLHEEGSDEYLINTTKVILTDKEFIAQKKAELQGENEAAEK